MILNPDNDAPPAKDQNLFAGTPDGRQSMDPELKPSRFRPTYRPMTDAEKTLHDDIKAKAVELETLINQTPAGRYQSLAMTDLELAVMWSIKGLLS